MGALAHCPRRLIAAVWAFAALVVDLFLLETETELRGGSSVPLGTIVLVAALCYSVLMLYEHPLHAYAVMWVLGLVGIVLPGFSPSVGLLVALYGVARRTPNTTAALALCAGVVPFSVTVYNGATFAGPFNVPIALTSGAISGVLAISVWATGRALWSGETRMARERRRAEQEQAKALKTERLRLSRELHDSLAHAFTGIILRAAGASNAWRAGTVDPAQLAAALRDIQDTGSQGMRELHRMLGLLRTVDAAPTPALSEPTVPTWEEVVCGAKAAGFEVEVTTSGAAEALDPSVEQAALRVVQEGVSNAMKYAPPGGRIEIGFAWPGGSLVITMGNEIGPEASGLRGGFGLTGLRERVSVAGGSLRVVNDSGRFLLRAALPTVSERRQEEIAS